MIALLSPAKTLDYARPLPALAPTRPHFADDADRLAGAASRLSKRRLAELMSISDKLATLNADRFRGFADAPERPAIYAFAGDVYTGLEAHSLDEPAIGFAQDHLRILSGLYGLLRPLDAIRPYRLEMGTRWAPRRKRLTDYWGGRIAGRLIDDVAQEGSGVVLNLASQEYFAAVEGRVPAGIRLVHVDFRESGPDGPRFVSFAAKRARGMMARWLCEHRIAEPESMKAFDSDGYRFDPGASENDRWTFMRG